MVDVLTQHPARHHQGGRAVARRRTSLADGVADRVKAASAEMLDAHPLYPGLDLA